MKALHFGAGNIGRGCIGKILSESGYDLIFADINPILIDAINYHKKYNIKLVKKNEEKIQSIKNVSAFNINDPNIISIISRVDLITTAVGFNVLNDLSLIIARGIIYKISIRSNRPLNIIACENKIFASSYLKTAVIRNLPIEYHSFLKKYIGFIDCTIDSIIPSIRNEQKEYLSLTSEDFQEWIVNPLQFKGKIPSIAYMQFSNNLISYIERKLFTLNTGHAIAAYLGLIKKYHTIHESILDDSIRSTVIKAMKESGKVLIQRYNFNEIDHLAYIDQIVLRFENPFLLDSLERIGRNPLQKLDKKERLIRPLIGTIEYQLSNICLIKGIAAALHYYNKNDSESMKIQSLIKTEGIEKATFYIFESSLNNITISSIISEYGLLKSIKN